MRARPDILLLVLDTQRIDRLSCYGYEREISPHVDALAADATRFTQAISPAQWTIPSHASMFTGLYPSHHTAVQSFAALPSTIPTLAERLAAGGYYTAAFCNNPLVGVVNNGLRRGFTSFLNYSGLLTSRPNQAAASARAISRVRQWFKRGLAGALHRIQDSFARSELLLTFAFTPLMVPLWQTALSFKGNTTKSLDDAARLLIERRGVERDQPIFSFVNLMGTHMPYHPQPRFLERFAPHVLRDKSARRYLHRFNSDIFGWLAPLTSLPDEHRVTLNGVYNAEVAGQDEQVGMFLQHLQARGVLDRTLVIVCADHGEHLGEKNLLGHTISAYNELVHVPLLIRDPSGDLPRHTTVEHPVSTRRIFHTTLAAAGLADHQEQSLSLAQSTIDAPGGDLAFAEAIPLQNVVNMMLRTQPDQVQMRALDQVRRAVLHDRYKLIQTGEDQFELYDIVDDPGEQLNLHDILPEQVEMLQERLREFVSTAAATPTPVQRTESDDPIVRRRLQDLGYLE